ncbi:hypothetical protein VTK73DRAFT_4526 [Phialemonium thermophilum]|uniref:Uncharacterized protein n=1 Tax=Phialemonium thermophilum TaxID=223376 RepID=A0ABR3WSW5_9PEZI
MPKAAQTNIQEPPIPLKCVLCPKQPFFSDLSHLLTHISSKSHLSYRFKTEIRSEKEKRARDSLAEFDEWYNRYSIQQLLADRLTAKEQRKSSKRVRPTSAANKSQHTTKRTKLQPETEVIDYSQTPPIAHWNTTSSNGLIQAYGLPQNYVSNSPIYEATTLGGPRGDFSICESPVNMKYELLRCEIESPKSSQLSEIATNLSTEEEVDRSRLKGAFWPGMSVFDSATEVQRRKRNQRKDASALKLMEQTSNEVEPTETIWSQDGQLQRVRDIYSTPSPEGSPEPDLLPKSKKKRRARRTVATVTRASQCRTRRFDAATTSDAASIGSTGNGVEAMGNKPQIVEDEYDCSPDGLYDIFRDDAEPSPVQYRHCTQSPPDHPALPSHNVNSPSQIPHDSAKNFEGYHRPALQTMPSNICIASSTSSSLKPNAMQYFHGAMAAHIPSYFHPHHDSGSGTLNPLSIQARHQFGFIPFLDDVQDGMNPEASGYQQLNSTDSMSYSGMFALGSQHSFQSAGSHRDSLSFDI